MAKLEICSKCRFEKESESGCRCSSCLTITERDGFVPKTNADRIRSMSDEELAELLERVEIEGYRDSSITPKMENGYSMGILEWLKSEAKE